MTSRPALKRETVLTGPAPQGADSDKKKRLATSRTDTRQLPQRISVAEPIEVARFWRDRSGRAIVVRLTEFKGHRLIDVRTFYTAGDGTLRPGKGLACGVRFLPQLARAIAKALTKARERGLIDNDECGQ